MVPLCRLSFIRCSVYIDENLFVEGGYGGQEAVQFREKSTFCASKWEACSSGLPRLLRCLLDMIIEAASGSATPIAKLIISPKVLGKLVFVHPRHVPLRLGSASIEIRRDIAAVCPDASITFKLAV